MQSVPLLSGGELVSERLGLNVDLLYSSFMVYSFNFLGSVFSAFFYAMLTRSISIEEYGIFVMILRYMGYFDPICNIHILAPQGHQPRE